MYYYDRYMFYDDILFTFDTRTEAAIIGSLCYS